MGQYLKIMKFYFSQAKNPCKGNIKVQTKKNNNEKTASEEMGQYLKIMKFYFSQAKNPCKGNIKVQTSTKLKEIHPLRFFLEKQNIYQYLLFK